MTGLTVRRILNNNVVQAVDDRDKQYVLMGRGIGHRTAPGQPVVERLIEQTFVSEGGHHGLQRLAAFVNDTPLDQLLVAGEAVAIAHKELGVAPSQSLLLPLADHLTFAIQRASEGTQVGYALRWELRRIYPEEVRVGELIVNHINSRLDLELPPSEAIAFALHLVSAQFTSPDFVKAARMTELIQDAFSIVSRSIGKEIDQESLSGSRFVTHLRFLTARVEGPPIGSRSTPQFLAPLFEQWPQAVEVARLIQARFEDRLQRGLDDDDIAYLTLHVARLIDSSS